VHGHPRTTALAGKRLRSVDETALGRALRAIAGSWKVKGLKRRLNPNSQLINNAIFAQYELAAEHQKYSPLAKIKMSSKSADFGGI
jgi:hypothetical protein